MNTRRQFIQKTVACFAAIGVFFNPIYSAIRTVYAKAKRMLVPKGTEMKSLPIEDVRSNKVFLAYRVNAKVLPQKHGFPVRAVAEDYYGSSWTKYVQAVEVDIAK
jgi:DMSO/TMAO reductase YedYZ molybdopterin-dependent catalytic subunit